MPEETGEAEQFAARFRRRLDDLVDASAAQAAPREIRGRARRLIAEIDSLLENPRFGREPTLETAFDDLRLQIEAVVKGL